MFKGLKPTTFIDCNNQEQIESFYTTVKDILGADCWALTIDGEILYNSYNNAKPMLEKINDKMVRNTLINDIHGILFVDFFRGKKDRTLILYMFGENHWFYHIRYFDSTKMFQINQYASAKYLENYA